MIPLFPRSADLPRVDHAQGCWVTDVEGKRYLDAASGALVVNIGHGDRTVIEAVRAQMSAAAYVHASAFTADILERYADALVGLVPMDSPSVYPLSGGSEATETALKAARTFHLANGEPDRSIVIGRDLSYHGNTLGALDVSGRMRLREPYLPWLGRSGRVPGVLEYRCPNPEHPSNCARWHASQLDDEIQRLGPERVAAFIAEPVGGAASGAALPPPGYWEEVTTVCRRHGVLVIADEVMTGFGRTGAWFASEHFALRPDVMTLAKGAGGGYWPLGVCVFAGHIAGPLLDSGFVHGFTFSHHLVGAAAGYAVIARIIESGLVEAAAEMGTVLGDRLLSEIGSHPNVGEVRGLGLLWAVELVFDRPTKQPFPREARMADRVTRMAREEGLIVYPSSGCAGGGDGDLVMVGPPLIVNEEEVDELVIRLRRALERLP